MSPTQRTLKKLRDDGWPLVQVVEHWNQYARIRQDLFGIIDVLAVGPKGTLAVQTTSGSGVSSRIRKMEESGVVPILNDAGWTVICHGWRKLKKVRGKKATYWDCRVVEVGDPPKITLNRPRKRKKISSSG